VPRSLWIAFVGLAVAACMPADDSTERGAIYIHLSASALTVRGDPDPNVSTSEVTFEHLTLVAGGDGMTCRETYYVDRGPTAAAAIDLLRPFTIERRSLKDKSCLVVAGFITTDSDPYVGEGVSDDDVRRLSRDGVLQLGAIHAIAHVRYPVPPGPEGILYDRRVDLVLFDASGSVKTAEPVPIPPGGKSDVVVRLSTEPFAVALLDASYDDLDDDGVVTTEELPASVVDALRGAASDKWTLVSAP
jgi:hypothetical protein